MKQNAWKTNIKVYKQKVNKWCPVFVATNSFIDCSTQTICHQNKKAQKSFETVTFITEYENNPDKLKLRPLLFVCMCVHTRAFLLTCIIIEVSFLQTLDYSFTPAILRLRINQATVCKNLLILTQKVSTNTQSSKEHLNLSGAYDLCLTLTVHFYSCSCSSVLKKIPSRVVWKTIKMVITSGYLWSW